MTRYLITFIQTDLVMWRRFEMSCSGSQQGSETEDCKHLKRFTNTLSQEVSCCVQFIISGN